MPGSSSTWRRAPGKPGATGRELGDSLSVAPGGGHPPGKFHCVIGRLAGHPEADAV
jgi:hypothetical protein